jgi:restriction endonuclease S subunit
MELKKYKLADIAKIEISGVDKKTIEGETPVRLCNFVDVYYNWAITKDKAKRFMIASAKQSEIDRFSIGKGMVAITKDSETKYDIGVATYIADNFDNVVLGYHCALITPNPTIVDGKYLNAFMHTQYIQKYFENNASGSGQRYTLSNDTISNIPVLLPPMEVQRTIGKLLADLDRKIELNRQINDNLEAMAKQLYDYWFVQFDFPNEEGKPYKSSGGAMMWNDKLKREIPQGWSTLPISAILDKYPTTKRYETKEYLSQGKYPIIDQGDTYIVGYTNEDDNLLTRHPAVLFGDHSTKVKFLDFDFARGADGTQILYSSNDAVSQYYLYLAVSTLQIPNPGYSRHFKYLKELPIVIPSLSIAIKFANIAKPLFKKWTNNIFNNIALTKQRDELLPLLMNGQASVNSD